MDAIDATKVISEASDVILAVGALGTAAYGLADTSKILPFINVSRAGLRTIETALSPFSKMLETLYPKDSWMSVIQGNWMNGKPLAEQKSIVKSLFRLGLTEANAEEIAGVLNLDSDKLKQAAANMASGTSLGTEQKNVLGRMDALISIRIGAAYEQADQIYRNASKSFAAVIAVLLAVWGNYLLEGNAATSYFVSSDFAKAVLVGLIAVPLAPVAKDVTSALGTGVQALQKIKRRKS